MLWSVRYECSGNGGRSGTLILDSTNLVAAVKDFMRFWRNRQAADKTFSSDSPYWGKIYFLEVMGWAPYEVDEKGNLIMAVHRDTGDRFFSWKIDGTSAGFTVEEWLKAAYE